ncbi:uncharacterized protein LOC132402601 [Hypanus sabinus]|uniref:uncharacterized protein LOC132402601 n=1 Tax=Hypanus sabinus TaxID=79690 RepID=UPI0028C3A23F|nr:uncharacterized protein LOC132402601 [Hypanus sabinus]
MLNEAIPKFLTGLINVEEATLGAPDTIVNQRRFTGEQLPHLEGHFGALIGERGEWTATITGVSGAVAAIACEIGRADAEKNCQSIRRQVKREEGYISKYSRDLESCISHIKETKKDINQTEKRIKIVEDQLDSLHELLNNRFALDYLLKHGTVALNELLGKVEVLKFRSEKFCNVDALVIVLNDIIAHILKLPNLLDGKVLQLEASTVEMLESLSGRLKAIEWSDSDVSQWC